MALRILVPVVPSERFYDAVVAAGDTLAREGGTITFLFTTLRPPPLWEEQEDVGNQTELEPDADLQGDADDTTESWQAQMREGLADALDLLRERGIGDEQVNVIFTDTDAPPAQAIADEAAAGAYDLVVLSRGEMIEMPDDAGGHGPRAIAEAVQELADDGVKLLVT